MKKLSSLFLVLLLSCSPQDHTWNNMEMVWIELDRPGVYNWVSGSDPSTGYQEFKCEEGPYEVEICDNRIRVKTDKPIKKALHLRGKYGSDAIEMEIMNERIFELWIYDPDPYGEVFRIFF